MSGKSTGLKKNMPCECGSGKKFRDCCFGKKPRSMVVEFNLGRKVSIDRIQANWKDGKVSFSGGGMDIAPKEVLAKMVYDRPKGEKVLVETPVGSKIDFSGGFSADEYSVIVAIDTNTKSVGGESISVCCVAAARAHKFSDLLWLQQYPVLCYEFRNISGKPENLVWREVLRRLHWSLRIQKIALVVDSDLGNIQRYNMRKLPIVDDFFLPSNITMVYASSDVGKEIAFNQVIGLADKEARTILDYVVAQPNDTRGLRPVVGKPYSHFRKWEISSTHSPDSIAVSRKKP